MFKEFQDVDQYFSQFSRKFEDENKSEQFQAFVRAQQSVWQNFRQFVSGDEWSKIFNFGNNYFIHVFEFDEMTGEMLSSIPVLNSDNFDFSVFNNIKNSEIKEYFRGCINFYFFKMLAKICAQDDQFRRSFRENASAVNMSSIIFLIAPSRSYADLASRSQNIDKILNNWEIKFENLEDSFRKKLQIDSAINHWLKNIRKYNNSYYLNQILFYSLCISPFVIFYYFIYQKIPNISEFNKLKDVVYLFVVAMGLAVIPYLWMLRRLAINVSSAMRLKTDASYRASLIQTFIAMNSEGQTKLNDAERAIFLNALFRPIDPNDREDLTPPSIIDLIKPSGRQGT